MGSTRMSKVADNVNRSIVWLDASVNDTERNINAQQSLRTPMNHLKTYIDDKECERYILSVPKSHRIILIVGGRVGQLILSRIHSLTQISSIFVYCMDKRNEEWTKTYKKVKGMFEELDELVLQVLSAQEKQITPDRFKEPLTINIFHTVSAGQEQSTTELNGQFVHSQILIDCLLRMRFTSADKNEFISYCKKQYANENPQLNIIREFEQDYSADRALRWYTRNCFLFNLLNKALRVQDIDLLYSFGFFIRDLHQQLKRNQYPTLIHVYRGQLMSKAEVQKLENSMGQLISMNSFFSTTVGREVAVVFSGDTEASNGDFQRVLFEIEADPHIVGVKSFADITSFSYIDDEEESYNLSVSYINLSTIATRKGDYNKALDWFHKAFEIRLQIVQSDDPGIAYIHSAIGAAYCHKGEYKRAIDSYNKELTINRRVFGEDHLKLGQSFSNIGGVYTKEGQYSEALEYQQKALIIQQKHLPKNHYLLGGLHTNIAASYRGLRQFDLALKHCHMALEIFEKILPAQHPDIPITYNCMAEIYTDMGNYQQALLYLEKAAAIYRQPVALIHPNAVAIEKNIQKIRNFLLSGK